MYLDDRKKRILKAIIDDYIATAEPIGSRTIARKYELGLSSATIRNEMADLEDLGFLAQPYTSAGRVPSDKGYRLYVDQLMDMDELPISEIDSIKDALEFKIKEIEQLIRIAASVLCKYTNYTSLATTPSVNRIVLKTIQIVYIDDLSVLVVLVSSGNLVKNSLTKLKFPTTRVEVEVLSNYINSRVSGIPLQNIMDVLGKPFKEDNSINTSLYESVLSGILECISQIDVADYFLDGTKNIFNFPEFKNLERARVFLEMLEQKEILKKIFGNNTNNNDIVDLSIQIGEENEILEAKDCSIILASYTMGKYKLGTIGIIGPTRMEYAKVVRYMNAIRDNLNIEIDKLIGE